MKAIVAILAVLLIGSIAIKLGGIYSNKSTLSERTAVYLDRVDETSIDSVRQSIVAEGKKLGVDIKPANVDIVYTDTDREALAQKFVGKIATFKNKQVAIVVKYDDNLFGFKIPQEIAHSKIVQVEVRQKVRPEYDELLR